MAIVKGIDEIETLNEVTIVIYIRGDFSLFHFMDEFEALLGLLQFGIQVYEDTVDKAVGF